MQETGLYVGPKTAMAATARGETLRRRMGSGPLTKLCAMVQVLFGVMPDGMPEQDPEKAAYCRGILRGLGYDPDLHTLSKKKVTRSRGRTLVVLIVRDHVGDPVQSVDEKRLAALQDDADYLAGWAQENPA